MWLLEIRKPARGQGEEKNHDGKDELTASAAVT